MISTSHMVGTQDYRNIARPAKQNRTTTSPTIRQEMRMFVPCPGTVRTVIQRLPQHLSFAWSVDLSYIEIIRSWVAEILVFRLFPVPSRHGGTLNSRRSASPLVRLVEGEEMWEAPEQPLVSSLKIGMGNSQIPQSPGWCSKLRLTIIVI
ncbi:hypothetical protein TNCV_3197921 [Trichonephila clavipes]|nr:hypothetical protein TNCV_3197921 [Trichonephila clavipes]